MDAKKQIQKGLAYVRQGIHRGFLHVFAGSTLVKLVSALSVLLLPNILSSKQYGALSVPDTFISYVLLFNDLGVSAALLRYCAVREEPGEQKAFFLFSLRFGLAADVVLTAIAGIVLYVFHRFGLYPINPLEVKLLAAFTFLPIAQFLLDDLTYYFRATCANKQYGRTSLIYTLGYALFPVAFALFMKVWGVVPGRYFGYAAALVAGFFMLRATPAFKSRALLLRREDKIGMVKYGVGQMTATLFSQVMPIVETTVVNLFVIDPTRRGSFRIASLLPSMLQVMTLSVIVFVFPYFAKHYADGVWVWKKSRQLYLSLAVAMAVFIPLGVVLTPVLVRVFFPTYNSPETVRVMCVFWAAYGVNAAFKTVTGNILAALGEVRFNLIVTFFASVAQGVFCYVLVSRFYLDGAAWGLLFAYSAYSLAGIVYLRYYCKKLIRAQAVFAHEPDGEDNP